MGYVFEEAGNREIKGVVHATWKDVSGNRAYNEITLFCEPKWFRMGSTRRTRKQVSCMRCLVALLGIE